MIVAASLLMGLGIAMGSTASILEAVFFLLIGIFVFVWVCALFPRVMAKRSYKQMLALNSGKPIRKTTCFYADEVEVLSSNGARARLQYANVKRVYGTERLIIAEFEGNVAVLLDKTGFVKGSPEQAQALLESRKQ